MTTEFNNQKIYTKSEHNNFTWFIVEQLYWIALGCADVPNKMVTMYTKVNLAWGFWVSCDVINLYSHHNTQLYGVSQVV